MVHELSTYPSIPFLTWLFKMLYWNPLGSLSFLGHEPPRLLSWPYNKPFSAEKQADGKLTSKSHRRPSHCWTLRGALQAREKCSFRTLHGVKYTGYRRGNSGTNLLLTSLTEEHGKRSIHVFPYDPWSLCSLDLGIVASLMGPVSEHTGRLFKRLHRCAVKLVLKRSEMDVELNING